MLKRIAETFAVLVVTMGLIAAGAGLYAWLGPESGEHPPILATLVPVPNLTEVEVEKLVLTHWWALPTSTQLGCTFNEIGKSRFTDSGFWVITMGFCTFTVNDKTGTVNP